MATKKPTRTSKKSTISSATKDSFSNLIAGLGINPGTPSLSALSSIQYNPISNNRWQLSVAYRSNTIAKNIIDIPAEDMLRAGVEITGGSGNDSEGFDPVQANRMTRELAMDEPALLESLKYAALFGGSVAMIIIDGQDPEEPLDIDTIPRGAYRGLMPMDRWVAVPDFGSLDFTYGRDFGVPLYYNVYSIASSTTPDVMGRTEAEQKAWYEQNSPHIRVHRSRMLRFEGFKQSMIQKPIDQWFAASVLEPIMDLVMYANTIHASTAELVYRSNTRVLSIDGYRSILANAELRQVLFEQMATMNWTQSNQGMTVIDSLDKFEAHPYNFAGLKDANEMILQQIAGATQIPLTRLLGQSPAGMNATGTSDLEIYYTGIGRRQETDLRLPIYTLFRIYSRHLFGTTLAEDFDFEFKPLWAMDDKDRAAIAQSIVSALTSVYSTGQISQRRLLEELKATSRVTGIFSTVTPEEIEAAVEETNQPVEETNQPVEADQEQPQNKADEAK